MQSAGLRRLERGLGTFVQPQRRQPMLFGRDHQLIVKRTRELVARTPDRAPARGWRYPRRVMARNRARWHRAHRA